MTREIQTYKADSFASFLISKLLQHGLNKHVEYTRIHAPAMQEDDINGISTFVQQSTNIAHDKLTLRYVEVA
jgi:hypothetical protein